MTKHVSERVGRTVSVVHILQVYIIPDWFISLPHWSSYILWHWWWPSVNTPLRFSWEVKFQRIQMFTSLVSYDQCPCQRELTPSAGQHCWPPQPPIPAAVSSPSGSPIGHATGTYTQGAVQQWIFQAVPGKWPPGTNKELKILSYDKQITYFKLLFMQSRIYRYVPNSSHIFGKQGII